MGIEKYETIISVLKFIQCILAGVCLYFIYKKKKEKTLKFNKFIIALCAIMLINSLLIEYIIPGQSFVIKRPPNYCGTTYQCTDCVDDVCTCKYTDADNKVQTTKCPKPDSYED